MQTEKTSPTVRHRWLTLATLVFAGEAIFFLPFVLPRVFRPTLLQVFDLTNLQLGWAFSAYGVVAMLSYFPGGPLADRFGPRRLMSIALLSTSAGGVLLATVPASQTLMMLYAFWGVTTVFLFWAGLIRATRQWGGASLQGSAFGLLDGGRGLVAALIGSLAVYGYSLLLPSDLETLSSQEQSRAFANVIWLFTGVTFAAAVSVWLVLPKDSAMDLKHDSHSATQRELGKWKHFRWDGVRMVARMPSVWLQAMIVLCAYVAYKGLDDVSLYAKEALGFDNVAAAYSSTLSMWMRPVAAVVAGVIADRVRVSTMTAVSFVVLTIGSSVITLDLLQPGMLVGFLVVIAATSAAVFSLRGLYFAIMREGNVPFRHTGAAVGIVSAVGYTPDVFMGPLMGVLLDRGPASSGDPTRGHQYVFAIVAGFSIVGFVTTWLFRRVNKNANAVNPIDTDCSDSVEHTV
ncbi:MFS transporter [Rhodopirellula sallentina]|uniref:Major facilitator superfamily MFS_1 n=1 Tax=Rhodopirellula sallentina SM41 TaxID=1263870 RepID=M5TX91_9BACT|nr:MFS transporter [Rhodopirellula sallentina]EMI53842.1 major facilitator superfamily MFS_1 [Rhodopirellula sallentina SM41]